MPSVIQSSVAPHNHCLMTDLNHKTCCSTLTRLFTTVNTDWRISTRFLKIKSVHHYGCVQNGMVAYCLLHCIYCKPPVSSSMCIQCVITMIALHCCYTALQICMLNSKSPVITSEICYKKYNIKKKQLCKFGAGLFVQMINDRRRVFQS